jgi:cytokinesis protein
MLTVQVVMICLLQGLTSANDMRTRISVRHQLDVANVGHVLHIMKDWNDPGMDRLIRQYEEEEEADRRDLAQEQNRQQLDQLRTPEEVLRALLDSTKGSKASAYLLNSFRHLLLIKEEGDERVRFFQLIDQLIQSIVMHDSPDLNQEFARAFGMSVTQVIGKFVEQQRLNDALDDLRTAKSRLGEVEREKTELLEEISAGDQGLVGRLKAQVADLEERLKNSRAATENIRNQMEGMRRDYEHRIAELELYITELFNMLREANHLDQVAEMGTGVIDRGKFIHDLREQWERKKTIKKLEGRHNKPMRSSTMDTLGSNLSESDDDSEEGEVLSANKASFGPIGPQPQRTKSSKSRAERGSTGIVGAYHAFSDAEDDRVLSHIETTLVSQSQVRLRAHRKPKLT